MFVGGFLYESELSEFIPSGWYHFMTFKDFFEVVTLTDLIKS